MQKRIVETTSDDIVRTPRLARSEGGGDVSLLELWLVVRKRRSWLFAGLLFGIAAAIAYTSMVQPVYESHATLQIGRIHDKGLIEEPVTLAVQLMDQYGPDSSDGDQREIPYLKQVTQASHTKQLLAAEILRLVAVGHSPGEAKEFLDDILTKVMQQHEQIYDGTIELLRRRLVATDEQIKILTVDIKGLGGLIARLKESQPIQASLLAMERGRMSVELGNLERDRVMLQRQLIKPYTNRSNVIAPASPTKTPVSPKKLTSLSVGVLFGLVLGLLAVFLREFADTAKKSVT